MTDPKFSFNFAKRAGALVTDETDDQVTLTHSPQVDSLALLEMRRVLKKPITLQATSKESFEHLLTNFYQKAHSAEHMAEEFSSNIELSQLMDDLPKPQDLLDTDNDAPIIKLINALLSEAIKQQASDIHFETFEERLSVRFRIDGILQEVLQPPRALAPLITSRIKIMAKLDIAEKRLPQDGRISIRIGGRAIDVRVSTLPTGHGERIVLRLLDKKAGQLDLTELGMDNDTLTVMEKLLAQPHGIILVTGPTGSGKTTTLYACLTRLNDISRNILTVEDPIEYDLPGIGQTQVNTKVELTFAKGLRAILRQDPDVVMVGEIRDGETAEIAVQASLTGHTVLSTLHTNSAIGAITRLRDMGVEPFLLSSSLIGVVAQRLVRVLCRHCKVATVANAQECGLLQHTLGPAPTIYHEQGCEACNHMGFQGRTGIYEIAFIDETVRRMIHDNVGEQDIEKYVRKSHCSMRDNGIRQILAGRTTIEEVLRVTRTQEEQS